MLACGLQAGFSAATFAPNGAKHVTPLLELCSGLWLLSPKLQSSHHGLQDPTLASSLPSYFHQTGFLSLSPASEFFPASGPLHFALPHPVTLFPVLFTPALFLLNVTFLEVSSLAIQ